MILKAEVLNFRKRLWSSCYNELLSLIQWCNPCRNSRCICARGERVHVAYRLELIRNMVWCYVTQLNLFCYSLLLHRLNPNAGKRFSGLWKIMSELKHFISRLTLESRRFHWLSFGTVPRHSGCTLIVARVISHCSMMTIRNFETSVSQLSETSKI